MVFYAAKKFIWVDHIHNLYVFPGQMFKFGDPKDLPLPTGVTNWKDFYEVVGK